MEIKYRKTETDLFVYPDAPMDIGFAPVAEKFISDLVKENPDLNLVIDMKDVGYVNSSGLGVLIFLSKLLKSNNRELRVANMNRTVQKVIDILDANDILNTYSYDDDLKSGE